MTKAELVDHVAAAVQLPKSQTDAVLTQCCRPLWTPWAGEAVDLRGLAVSTSATVSRGPDATPARGTPSRFRPKLSRSLRRGKPSRNGCNPAPRLRAGPA